MAEAGPQTGEQTAAVDLVAATLAGLEDATRTTDFYGELCETLCRSVGFERAIVLGYDVDLRRVQPQGSFGLPASAFEEAYVDPDTASFVRDALEQDAVVELDGDLLMAQAPLAFQPLAEGRRVVCAPMTAAGRWVGVVLADRPASGPPLTAAQREVLWTVGKGVALVTMARRATRKDERLHVLQGRIDLARDVHDGAIQHLFGVALALEGPGPLAAEERARCASEVQAALAELRRVVGGSEVRPPLRTTIGDTVSRWAAAHPDLLVTFDPAAVDDVPPVLGHLVHTMLSETLRNARKHADPSAVEVRTRRLEGALVVDVENDGVPATPRHESAGLGLRLLGIEALQAGGVLESGPAAGDRWTVRLVVPVGA